MKILVIEDDHRIAQALKKGLNQERHNVDLALNGNEGYDLAASEPYDVIVLDRLLPGIDGLTICKSLRAEKVQTPILMLTALGSTSDRINGLDMGADDYLVKPFSFEELLARLRALTRRGHAVKTDALHLADLELNPQTFVVTRASTTLTLTNKEFSLLAYLLRHANTIISKDQLINHVWNYDSDILPNTVEVYVKNLRTKLDKPFPHSPPLLRTVRGFGYILEGKQT